MSRPPTTTTRRPHGCRCDRSGWSDRWERWVLVRYKCHYSAWGGRRRQDSPWSLVRCTGCGREWRTRAGYVELLPDGQLELPLPAVCTDDLLDLL